MISATYTKLHQILGFSYDDIVEFCQSFGIPATVSSVISSNNTYKVTDRKKDFQDFKKDFSKDVQKIFTNNINSAISPFVTNVLLAIFKGCISYNFCDDLDYEISRTYDVDGKYYPCFRLWGGSENYELKNNNKKSEYDLCSKCWARQFCKLCKVAILQSEMESPIRDKSGEVYCIDQYFYECIMEILIEYLYLDKIDILKNNFVNNFSVY